MRTKTTVSTTLQFGNNWVPPYDTTGNRPWNVNPPCVPWPNPYPPYVPYVPWVPPVITFPPVIVRPRAPVRRPTPTKKRAPVRRHNMTKRTGKKETFITLVLDRSGSMHHIRQTALDSLNEQIGSIKKHAKKGGKTYVSLILFDDTIDVLYENVPVADVSLLELNDYQTGGMTALRDAMLTAIETMQGKQNDKKNQGFLTVLISDGAENASGTTNEQLRSQIEELERTDKWTFTYMLDGHNWEQATQFARATGVPLGNVSVFTADVGGTKAMSAAITGSSVNYMMARDVGEQSTPTFYNKGDGAESRVSE